MAIGQVKNIGGLLFLEQAVKVAGTDVLPHTWYNRTMTDIITHIEQVNEVASLYITGKNETEIAAELDIPKSRASSLLKEWKAMASNSEAVRSRAREALSTADTHYSKLIRQAYEVIDDANNTSSQAQKLQALKLVMDLESRRIDMLQKAGLLENKELAEQLMETERKQELLMEILKTVSSQCDTCKPKVLSRLSEVQENMTEAVVVNES